MKFWRLKLGLLACLLSLSAARGQGVVSSSEVLRAALTDPRLQRQQQQVDFLERTNHDLPWVDEMEVRTETNRLDWERQEYLFRLSFISPEERASQRRLHQKNTALAAIDQQLTLRRLLFQRYSLLVRQHYLRRRLPLLRQQAAVFADQLTVYRRLAEATVQFKLDDYLSAEADLHQVQQEILAAGRKNQRWQTELLAGLPATAGQTTDSTRWPSLNQLRSLLELLPTEAELHPRLQERQLMVEQKAAEFELEEAETQRIFDFAQVRYSGRDDLIFQEELSFGLAFRLPTKGANKLDLHELTLERLEQETRLLNIQTELNQEISQTRQQMESLLAQHELATAQLEGSHLATSLQRYPQLADADPLLLLKIQAENTNRQLDLLELEEDIFLTYLDLLDVTGVLGQPPLRNFLTPELELLAE